MAIERITPSPGQESVWDYPRPPRLEPFDGRLKVVHDGVTLVDTTAGYRVLETSHPPTYYLPPADVDLDRFERCAGSSFCEWKGQAVYYALETGGVTAPRVAWAYPNPTPAFGSIRDYLSIYASKVDACFVNGEQVRSQAGDFYGGWITSNIVGPFKGEPGTRFW